jgi:predicted nucleic acid-binding protein
MLLARAEEFEMLGVMGMDAVHVACTEKVGAVLLTTDDDLVKIMKKNTLHTSIHTDNPLHWLMEMNQNGE